MKFFRRHAWVGALLVLLSVGLPGWVHADGLEALSQFIKQTRSGRAQFTQVVTSPARQGQVARSKTSSGSFEFQRPGKFRFDYRKPFVQTLVADGQTLWMHDVDLSQVTARNQAQVLGSTPVALLTAASDLEALKVDFTFKTEPDRDGLQWVRATPQKTDGQIQSVLVGLRTTDKGVALAVLDVQDGLGQRSVLSFSAFELNPAVPASSFVFKVPAGADVIRQ
ncbi:MAG: outer membrane lipoprotein chaperone LolA [Limnohabitans sp.]